MWCGVCVCPHQEKKSLKTIKNLGNEKEVLKADIREVEEHFQKVRRFPEASLNVP
jgi:hypothetical protein